MSLTRRFVGGLAAGVGAAALLVAAALLFRARGVAIDLYALAGARGGLLGDLAGKTAAEIRVLCADEARAEACRAVFPFRPAPDPSALLDYYRTHGRGLLADRSRELLEAGDFDRIRRSVTRRDYTGVGLFAKADDPYYFLSDYVAGLKALMPKGLAEGQVLLTGTAGKGADLAPLIALAEADDGIWLSGAPFHAFLATEKAKREMNLLGGVSLAAILLLGLLLFRSPRFILPTAAAIGLGFLAGTVTVFALFPRPHLLTFLFGTTLIGLGVDYCYHALAGARRRPLLKAFATTALAFSPLMFSSVAVLNQMAVFTIAGLAVILALAVSGWLAQWSSGCGAARTGLRSRGGGVVRPCLLLLLLLVCAVGIPRLALSCDPSRFYAPPPLLARGEAKVAALLGGGAQRFAVVTGGSLEEALQEEERNGVKGLSRLVPSLRRQWENAALVERMGRSGQSPVPSGEFVTLDTLPAPLRALADAMILTDGDRVRLVSPLAEGADVPCGETVAAVEPKAALARMFASLTDEARHLVGVSFAVMALALLALFRKRVLVYALPLAAAVTATAGTLGWMGETLTLFHLLSFFVMTGIGVDYVIFHGMFELVGLECLSPESTDSNTLNLRTSNTSRVVRFSFLTSLVGFGALGFTSFPPMRALGLTLALGLFYSYLFSRWGAAGGRLPCRGAIGAIAPADIKPLKPSPWYVQKEKGATRLGILTLWHIYRLFGKTAAKVAALVPVVCVAPFCRGVGWRRLLNFAWSRLDIVDAATRRRDIPRFTFTGDADWRQGGAFLISSHLGAIEVLAALCDPSRPTVHAFRQMTHDPVFTRFLAARLNGFALHAVEDIGVATAVEMQEAVGRGDLVLMAGDRVSASGGRTVRRDFLGREREWPEGVFRFARLMECPVYAVAAVRTGWNAYEVAARRLDAADLLGGYAAFLEGEVRAHPDQWYQFD